MTIIYQVWYWDSMASSYGVPYLEDTYASEEKARARAKELNHAERTYWMANCSQKGASNYQDIAYVRAVELK